MSAPVGVGAPYLPRRTGRGSAFPRCRRRRGPATAPTGSSMRRYSSRSTAEHADDAGDRAEDDRAEGRHPVAGAGDGDEAGEEAVDGHAAVPDLVARVDAERAPRGRRRRRRAWCWWRRGRCRAASIAESVLPGLNPYQPNQRMTPPTAAMVMSWPGIVPPPSRLNLRPRRGPRAMAPGEGDEAADGVHDRRAGEVVERRRA